MSGLNLPGSYMQGSNANYLGYVSDLIEFLSSPLAHSIILGHPNGIAGTYPAFVPVEWNDWWHSAWIDNKDLQSIVTSMLQNTSDVLHDLPPSIRTIVEAVHRLVLPRAASNDIPDFLMRETQRFGMTPKKRHEVEKMCALIQEVAGQPNLAPVRHIVDVGAGQGYLTRNLAARPMCFDILALDSNDLQIEGAAKRRAELERWQQKVFGRRKAKGSTQSDKDYAISTATSSSGPPAGTITPTTVFVDADTLPTVIDEWMGDRSGTGHPAPLLLVGLHACGSLTPGILRSFAAMYRRQRSIGNTDHSWRCSGLVLVGCCYNRIRDIERDVPMSRSLLGHPLLPSLRLQSLHLHLAAQVTHDWIFDWASFELGLRKIVYRAMLERLFPEHTGEMYKHNLAVGRFNDSAYTSWPEYLTRVAERLENQGMSKEQLIERAKGAYDPRLERRLEMLHVLRCMMGPVVESLLLMDRWMYLREQLDEDVEVRMINLFDQSTGSARNVALVANI